MSTVTQMGSSHREKIECQELAESQHLDVLAIMETQLTEHNPDAQQHTVNPKMEPTLHTLSPEK